MDPALRLALSFHSMPPPSGLGIWLFFLPDISPLCLLSHLQATLLHNPSLPFLFPIQATLP